MEGSAITMPTTIDRLTIQTLSTLSPGVSNYAMYCNGCTGVTLKNSTDVITIGALRLHYAGGDLVQIGSA